MKSALSKNPILIIDREGLIGEPLSLKLSKEFSVVFVSQKDWDLDNENIIFVPFFGKFPSIPDNKYSHVIFINGETGDLGFLPKIIEKVKDVNAEFIFAEGLSLKREYNMNKILSLYPSAKIVLLGDIFDDKLILRQENFASTVNKFIYQAQKFGKMQVLGEGMRETYPVFLRDVVDGIIDLVFGVYKKHSLFYLFPKPVSELSLAHMVQKMNPEITIDFVRHDPISGDFSFPPDGINLLSDKYMLAKKIRSIDIKNNSFYQQGSGEKLQVKKIIRLSSFVVWMLIFLLFFPLVFTIFFSWLGLNILNYAKGEVNKGNLANVKSSLHLSQTFFYLGEQTANLLLFQTKTIGAESSLKNLSQNLDSGYKISESLSQAFSSSAYFSKVLSGESKNPAGDFAIGENYLKNSIVTLNKLKAEGKIPALISQNIESISPLIKLLSAASDILPSIFGLEGPKTYLILFQDNLDLRPGGGHIDSYGILKFSLGKIIEFSLHNISDADQQLRGHVEPPFALRRYLPTQHWYMADSNFDVDFAKSAQSASNFLLVETGQKADGIIGMDKSLMAKITKAKTSYYLIAQAISDALTQKQLLLELNSDSQNIFTVNGWSSSLWDERIDNAGKVNDFVGISEANLGLNKINDFIKRQIIQNVKIELDGSLLEEINLSYKNTNTSLSDGNYKNYLRLILPSDTSLSGVLINDAPQVLIDAITDPLVYEAKKFKAPKGLEIEKSIENGKIIYGFLVNISAGELVRINIQYTVQRKTTFNENSFSYNLKIFKQPGVNVLPYFLTLYYPDNLNIVKAEDFQKKDNTISYSQNIIEDKNLIVNFAKK